MAKKEALKYRIPDEWYLYDAASVARVLAEAHGAIHAFLSAPFLRSWLEHAEADQTRREVLGTCDLDGRVVTNEGEKTYADPRLQSVSDAYGWLAHLDRETPFSVEIVLELHRRLVADDVDGLRPKERHAFFGDPRMRGAKGGRECREALSALVEALSADDTTHPELVRGLAAHYHLWAMHPFGSGNGLTARGLECLFRQNAGLRGVHFLALSDFYVAHQESYRESLTAARRAGHNLTPFLEFALAGLKLECDRRLAHIRRETALALFRNTMTSLFERIRSGKKRPVVARQIGILELLLEQEQRPLREIYYRLMAAYEPLRNPWKAFLRDISDLVEIGAAVESGKTLRLRLSWPAEITAARFVDHYQAGRFSRPTRRAETGAHPRTA